MSGFISYAIGREVAEDVYLGKLSIPTGWEIDTSLNADSSPGEVFRANGFYAYALKPSASNTSVSADTRVLAFRGTEFTLATINDLYVALHGISFS